MIEFDSPDKFIGTGIALLVAGLAAAGGSVAAAKIGSNSAAASGEQNAVASDKQLAYLQGKDAQDQANFASTAAENKREFDATQNLNLDQYNQKESRLAPYRSLGASATGTLHDLMGVPMVQVPSGAARPASSSAPASGMAAGALPSGGGDLPTIDPSKDLGAQISSYFKSRGASDQETPYWVEKWPELVARGQELGDPTYAQKRLSEADALGGGGGSPASSTTPATKGFSVMPGSAPPSLASLYVRTAPLSALRN